MLIAVSMTAVILICTNAVGAFAASSGDIPRSRPKPNPEFLSVPPLDVDVLAPDDMQPSLVARLLDEASSVWGQVGVRFAWHVGDSPSSPVRVIVADEIRSAGPDLPIGWIVFDGPGVPEPQIHVSRANGLRLLQATPGVGGRFATMPRREVEVLMGRALGRALAHELGHYLLASEAHTARGLMKAQFPAYALFDESRSPLGFDEQEREALGRRFGLKAAPTSDL